MISLYSYITVIFLFDVYILIYICLLLCFVGKFYNNLKDLIRLCDLDQISMSTIQFWWKVEINVASLYIAHVALETIEVSYGKYYSNGIIEANVETIHRYLSFVLLELITLLWLLIICFFKGYSKILATWFCWRLIWFSQSIYLDFEYMVTLE
jgi:hypothetical protein